MARSKSDTAGGRDIEGLRTVLALHAIAMSEITHGVLVVDSELRVALFNRRCADILGLPPQSIYPGLSLRALLDQTASALNLPTATTDRMWRELSTTFAQGEGFQFERRIHLDGLITLTCRPTSGGGWVCT